MVPLPTAQGELPNLHALDPLMFQALCRDLYQLEPNISIAEVFGTSGQSQRGVDILAVHRSDDGVSVGQCKRVQPQDLTIALIREASQEFLRHIDYWRERRVRRFILFVAPDASKTQIQEEHLRQRSEFERLGIDYELWGQAAIVNKLRPHPGIVRTYLRDPWTDLLCGGGVSGFPRESIAIDRMLHVQIDVLSTHVSTAAEAEVEQLRSRWREGRRSEAAEGLARLRDPGRWQAFPAKLQATIVRFEAQLALESDAMSRAQDLADEAERLDPQSNLRLRALIARRQTGVDEALRILGDSSDVEAITLRSGLLLEANRVTEALTLLQQAAGVAEGHRLQALGYVLLQDLVQARLEIDKAAELAPTWHSVIHSKAIVYYLSGLSPAALPRGLPSWPEPEHWEFVKTDDKSRGYFRTSAEAIAQIETASSIDERPVYETWRLAAIANDPERRDEANDYARQVLERDPGQYRAMVWVIAKRFDVDLERSAAAIEERVRASKASISEIVALVLWRVQKGDHDGAAALLALSRAQFTEANAEQLWTLWNVQVAAARGEPLTDASAASGPETPESRLVRLRAKAIATGDWDELNAELQTRHATGDGQASFELCRLLATLGRWSEAATVAKTLTSRVGTAESLRLACATLYNAKAYTDALAMLDAHRAVFPHAELPNDMRRLRLLAQRQLGMLPTAAAEAEDLFRREPSRAHFSLLADLYFQKGDFGALAVLARQHEHFDDLSVIDLLRLAMRVSAEDRALATALWKRGVSLGVADSEVAGAVEVGYRLGLDKDLRTLLQRMMSVAGEPGTGVERVSFDDVKAMLTARREDTERVYRMYRAGTIPVHLLAQRLRRPLAWWYHRALAINQTAGRSDAGPTLTRHGWRTELSVKFELGTRLRLHADTTALLTSHHFDLLDDLESTFAPIRVPHPTPIALAQMRDSLLPHQPARREALQVVFDFANSKAIEVVPAQEVAGGAFPVTSDEGMLAMAAANGWLLVDFLPLTGVNAVPVTLAPADEGRVRTGHCVVDALRLLGELSEDESARARDALGPEHAQPLCRDLSAGAVLLCSSGILEYLAAGGALPAATRVFSIRMVVDDFDRSILGELEAFKTAEADAGWLTNLLDRVNKGIEHGIYELLPEMDHTDSPAADGAEESPTLTCLLDLLRFVPTEGDVIWVDDRWTTGHVHRDGAPVLDTFDVVHILRERGKISDSRFSSLVHSFRDADLRLFALSPSELTERTRQAIDKDRHLTETRELRTIRRQYARGLADGENLIVSGDDPRRTNEWPYLLTSGAAVINAIVELWGEDQPAEVAQLRAEWLLRQLYVPNRGRGFTVASDVDGLDYQMEAVALTALLSHAITLSSSDQRAQEMRRQYLEWIYERLIRRRMDADPNLSTLIVDSLKAVLNRAMDDSTVAVEHPRLARLLVRRLVADFPEDLNIRLAEDPAFVTALGVSGNRVFKIGPHEVQADLFWNAAADVVRSKTERTIPAAGHDLILKLDDESVPSQLIVEDPPARRQYLLLTNEIGILADSVAIRDITLRGLAPSFDLPRPSADEAIARVASIDVPGDRVMEIARLRRASAQSHYEDLQRKVSKHESVEPADFLLEDVDALTRHLRLGADPDGASLTARLEHAASTLIDEVGLEETIVRLAGLPNALPVPVYDAVEALSSAARRQLLGRLTRSVGASPIAAVNVARLAGHFAGGPGYARYARWCARRSVLQSLTTHTEAWREVLRVCANELAHMATFRQLPVDVRLCLVWAHGDRIFRILVNAGASEEWIRDRFGAWSSRLPAEIVFADPAYLAEAAHPKHLDLTAFGLAAASHALDAKPVDDFLRKELTQFIERDHSRMLALLRQPGLRPDSLDSIMSPSRTPNALGLLEPSLNERMAATTLLAQVGAALDAIVAGEANPGWLVLGAVVNDQELPLEFADRVRQVVASVDLAPLYKREKGLAIVAATFVSQQAGRFGTEVVAHVRASLIALASEISTAWTTNPDEHAIQALLSYPIYLYSQADTESSTRFTHVASLLDDLINRLPAMLDKAQYFVDRLVEGLPNHHSRALWRLQVRLRALR